MSGTRRDDLDDYVVKLPARAPAPASVVVAEQAQEVPLAAGSARATQALFSIMFVFGGIIGGFAVPFALTILSVMTFSTPSAGERTFALWLGVVVALCGVAAGISSWRPWRKAPSLSIGRDEVIVRYPGFKRPFVVPRTLVRVVTIDDRPIVLFQRNDRFPVTGRVPDESFADALDLHPANPWEPAAPESRILFPFPSPARRAAHQYLFSADGSALPFLRVNPSDVPNVAIVLDESLKTPRLPLGLALFGRVPVFAGGRAVRGMLVRVGNTARAEAAFDRWGVVRPIDAEDVVEEKLLLPKPLFGLRAVVYAALLLGPAILHVLRDLL